MIGRERTRKERTVEKKTPITSPLFFHRVTNSALSIIVKEKDKAAAVNIAFDGLALSSSDSLKPLEEHLSHTLFLHLHLHF